MKIDYRFVTKENFLEITKDLRSLAFSENNDVDLEPLLSDEEKEKRAILADSLKFGYRLYLLAFAGNKCAGWSWGYQKSSMEYYMCNSAVLSEYRRQGIYKTMLKMTLDKVKEDGFIEITSKHHACNNEVLLPKMRSGFMVSGFEINPRFGTLITLSYFTNKKVEHAFLQRTGFRK